MSVGHEEKGSGSNANHPPQPTETKVTGKSRMDRLSHSKQRKNLKSLKLIGVLYCFASEVWGKGLSMMQETVGLTRFAPFFAAGFLTAAIAVSCFGSAAAVLGIAGATVLGAPTSELFAGLFGGLTAAAVYGRRSNRA